MSRIIFLIFELPAEANSSLLKIDGAKFFSNVAGVLISASPPVALTFGVQPFNS